MYKIDTQSERETQINESLMYRDRKTTRWRGLDTNNKNQLRPHEAVSAQKLTLALASGQV